MKKMLILLLVLGLTSVASAALEISINGNYDLDYIEICPSDTLILDIGTDIPIGPGGVGEGLWALGCATTCGAISGGIVIPAHADYEIGIVPSFEDLGVNGHPVGHNGVAGWIYSFGAEIPAGTIYDQINFHCESENGPTIVSLYQLDDNGTVVAVWDTITINQVPEPASMLLLGLGGLLLRRRK